MESHPPHSIQVTSYLLRCWEERVGPSEEDVAPRFLLMEVNGSEVHGFASLDELYQFLMHHFGLQANSQAEERAMAATSASPLGAKAPPFSDC